MPKIERVGTNVEKVLKLSDLYMQFNYSLEPDDEDWNFKYNHEPEFGYLLSVEINGCHEFLIGFKNRSKGLVVATIEVVYNEYQAPDIKYKKKEEESIFLVINGSYSEDYIECNEEEIEFMLPTNKIIIYND